MFMKSDVTFALDSELLKKFIEFVEGNNSTPDEEIAKAIKDYIGDGGTDDYCCSD